MKKGVLFLLLFGSFFAQGQSLKEALFSGKLKNEPGTVIRKGEDLSTKIDTSTRRTVANTDSAKTSVAGAAVNTNSTTTNAASAQGTATPATGTAPAITNPAATGSDATPKPETAATTADTAAATETSAVPAKPKDNTALFKEFMEGFRSTLESDVIPNKKLKKGSYYVQLTYVIGTDGQTSVTDLYVDPENKFLQQQIADRLNAEMPKLNPVLQSNGTARKQTKRYNFTLEKQ